MIIRRIFSHMWECCLTVCLRFGRYLMVYRIRRMPAAVQILHDLDTTRKCFGIISPHCAGSCWNIARKESVWQSLSLTNHLPGALRFSKRRWGSWVEYDYWWHLSIDGFRFPGCIGNSTQYSRFLPGSYMPAGVSPLFRFVGIERWNSLKFEAIAISPDVILHHCLLRS